MPLEIDGMEINYDKVPVPHMVGGVRRYLENGIAPGHFLTAVITNDLGQAVAHGDSNNQAALADWVRFFYNYTPRDCWGSRDIMEAWMRKRLS